MNSETFTVGELAERLERSSPEFSAGYYARQIRGWAQQELLGPGVRRSGEGPTAPQLFNRYHLATARIFSALTRLGFNASQLRVVRSIFTTHAIRTVVDDYLSPKANWDDLQPWYLVLYTAETGDVVGGHFSTTTSINQSASAGGPIVLVIRVSALFRALFEEPSQPAVPDKEA